jgi:nitroimidazol reductase NimA-like FMN-containing flavoprotein (pyridoxamine 5'-phosphate oxidase superfamily)
MSSPTRKLITMTDAEIADFLDTQPYCVFGTLGARGWPHMVTLGFAIIDGDVMFQSFAKSQKIVNLQRDKKISCLFEDPGVAYAEIRGVLIEGTAEIIEDRATIVTTVNEVNGHFARAMDRSPEGVSPVPVERVANKRVAVRVHAERTRSWDHSKLGGRY